MNERFHQETPQWAPVSWRLSSPRLDGLLIAADQQKEKRVTHSVGHVILSINGKWGLCYIMGLRKAMARTQGTLLGASYLDLPSPTVKVNVKQ